jgi:type II secretory pathway component GspD/PulD (secretin)
MKATTCIFLLLAWGTALAQGSLEVIELRHTTAERVLPALRPLLEPGGVLTGQRSQLIVRTSPRNLEELRRALAALDAPARRLMISVREERGLASRSRRGGESSRRIWVKVEEVRP